MATIKKRDGLPFRDGKNDALVETVEGAEIPRSKVRKIGGEYFTPNVSVFNINGTNYRITSPKIAYDYSTDTYRLKEEVPYYGVIGFVGNDFRLGYFSVFKGGPKIIISNADGTKTEYPLLSGKVITEECGYSENLSTGNFELNASKVKKLRSYQSGSLHYNANEQNPLVGSVKKHFEKTGMYISDLAIKLSEFLNGYSFGIEFETNNGTIPFYKVYDNGLVPLKDGSLKLSNGQYPYEYTTIPLNGKKGIQAIINICEDLGKYCTFDRTCSAHIHFGNIRLDKVYLLAYYELIRTVQDQMFSLVPHYKTDPVKIAGLEKNYCQKLKPLKFNNLQKIGTTSDKSEYNRLINSNYKILYAFLAGQDEQDVQAVAPSTSRRQHPQGDSKWNRRNRYYVQNLLPAVFDGGTIESRLHQGTFNADKILGWMFLNIAMLWFADTYTLEILAGTYKNVKLKQIVSKFAQHIDKSGFLEPIMLNYLEEREATMQKLYAMQDYLGVNEIKTDNVPLTGLFLRTTQNKVEALLKKSLMIFNNKGYVQERAEKWKRNLSDASDGINSDYKVIEKKVNIE